MWGTCHCRSGLIPGACVAEVPFPPMSSGFPPCSPHKLKLLSSNWNHLLEFEEPFCQRAPTKSCSSVYLFILASGLNGETKSNSLLFTKINFTRNRQLDSYSLF